MRRAGASLPQSRAYEVMTEHTYFEYEEFEWHRYRSFSAKGDTPADVRWPECTLEPDQRISERRETYHGLAGRNVWRGAGVLSVEGTHGSAQR